VRAVKQSLLNTLSVVSIVRARVAACKSLESIVTSKSVSLTSHWDVKGGIF
jgi:hypothetical protein